MTSTSCNRCRAETEITIIKFADGEADPLRIRLKEFPLRTCPEGHRQFVRPDFAAELLQHLTEEDEPRNSSQSRTIGISFRSMSNSRISNRSAST